MDPNKTKVEYLEVRVEKVEKQAFKEAADLAGLALSAWVRERLRLVAREELGKAGRDVAFLPQQVRTRLLTQESPLGWRIGGVARRVRLL